MAYCNDPRLLSSPTEQRLAFEHLIGDEDTPPECVRSSSPALWSRDIVTHLHVWEEALCMSTKVFEKASTHLAPPTCH